MVYERSAGIIPFRRTANGVEFLLLHSVMVRNPDAAWEFPKGSIEVGEEEVEAALREIREEAGLTQVKILPDFRDHVEYHYRRAGREIEKTVVFFVGEVSDTGPLPDAALTREHGPHPQEGVWHVWSSERETHRRLFHPGMLKLLERASFFLYEHDRIERNRAGQGYPVE